MCSLDFHPLLQFEVEQLVHRECRAFGGNQLDERKELGKFTKLTKIAECN